MTTTEHTDDPTARTHPGYQLSDVDRRTVEQVEESWPVLARFVTGSAPAQILTDLDGLASTIEHASQVAGARLTRKPEHEAERMVRAMFRRSGAGLGLVTVNTDPDKAHTATNWSGLESDPEFCPVVGFATIEAGGIVARAIGRHRWPMVEGEQVAPQAVALMVRPRVLHAEQVLTLEGDRTVRTYRPLNGLIYPVPVTHDDGSTEWLPGAEVVGVVRVYATIEQAEQDRDELARAVGTITAAMRPAIEPDVFDTDDDREHFVPVG
jgi:hypothetical protein